MDLERFQDIFYFILVNNYHRGYNLIRDYATSLTLEEIIWTDKFFLDDLDKKKFIPNEKKLTELEHYVEMFQSPFLLHRDFLCLALPKMIRLCRDMYSI